MWGSVSHSQFQNCASAAQFHFLLGAGFPVIACPGDIAEPVPAARLGLESVEIYTIGIGIAAGGEYLIPFPDSLDVVQHRVVIQKFSVLAVIGIQRTVEFHIGIGKGLARFIGDPEFQDRGAEFLGGFHIVWPFKGQRQFLGQTYFSLQSQTFVEKDSVKEDGRLLKAYLQAINEDFNRQ